MVLFFLLFFFFLFSPFSESDYFFGHLYRTGAVPIFTHDFPLYWVGPTNLLDAEKIGLLRVLLY